MAVDVHTIHHTDLHPVPRFTPEEGRTFAELLVTDLDAAGLPQRAGTAREALALALEARRLETGWRTAVEAAPKVGGPRRAMIDVLKRLRSAARVVGELTEAEDAAGPIAARIATFLEVTGIGGSAWDLAETADGLVAAIDADARARLVANAVMRKAVVALEDAEATLDGVLREIVPGGVREFRLLRERQLEKLAVAVFGAFADTEHDPEKRRVALARFLEARRQRSQRYMAARPARRSKQAATTVT